MKILNLYSGIGGNRKLWGDEHEITSVEYDPAIAEVYRSYFPNDTLIVGDAHQYLLDHFDEFDFVWASPPCPTHSQLQSMIIANKKEVVYPDMKLYQEIIVLMKWFRGKFCVENVKPYYPPLIPATAKLHRHLFWSNFKLGLFETNDTRKHVDIKNSSTIYGFNLEHTNLKDKAKCLKNMVDPKVSQYILNCAMDIITKSNTEQTELF
jgi:DNA (cytosine-5)-methyltransferase 1